DVVDPNDIRIDVNSASYDINGNRAYAGIYYDIERREIYSAFLKNKYSLADEEMMNVSGKVLFDNNTSSYKIAAPLKLDDFNTRGNYLNYNTAQCRISGSGKINIPGDYGQVVINGVGDVIHNKISDSVSIDVIMPLDFYFSKAATKLMIDSVKRANLKGVSFNMKEYESRMALIVGTKKASSLVKEINLYGMPKKIPDELDNMFVFNDISLSWNKNLNSFVSSGPIGIGNIKTDVINKYVDGIVEVQPLSSGGKITLYLQLDEKTWYFFSYSNGVMQSISSDINYNSILVETKDRKRVASAQKGEEPYEYVVATRKKYQDFLRKMARLGMLINHGK
ncbi:MAG: hypothetical protein U9R32_09980, partial [Bacteroidota bacterium]|nr:hypothetical protein [Bacteroidota bacterium]